MGHEAESTEEPKPLFKKGRLRINGWSDWTDFNSPYMNWISAELLRVHFERAYYKHTLEVNFALLGFNLCIEWYLQEGGEP